MADKAEVFSRMIELERELKDCKGRMRSKAVATQCGAQSQFSHANEELRTLVHSLSGVELKEFADYRKSSLRA